MRNALKTQNKSFNFPKIDNIDNTTTQKLLFYTNELCNLQLLLKHEKYIRRNLKFQKKKKKKWMKNIFQKRNL